MKMCFQRLCLWFLNVYFARNINISVVTFYIALMLRQQLNIVKYIVQQLSILVTLICWIVMGYS